jgi:serine phosphatase RsbU (regulator of sigma subunit)
MRASSCSRSRTSDCDLTVRRTRFSTPHRPGNTRFSPTPVTPRNPVTTTALARLGHPPEEIMGQLDGVVAAHGEETGATCLYAAYDPASRRCRLTSAGHLPPALRHPGGTTEFLDIPAGLLLGAGPGRYPATDIDLPEGSVLALYTDGLVEQPGQDIATGMARLARALAAGPPRSLDDLCDNVLASLSPHPRDDIALLLARTTAQTAR